MPPTRSPRLWLIGSTVKAVREARGIPANRFASDVGISHAHLSNIENARKQASMPVVVRIAARLSIGVDDITIDLAQVPQMVGLSRRADRGKDQELEAADADQEASA